MMLIYVSRSSSLRSSGLPESSRFLYFPLSVLSDVNKIDDICVLTPELSLVVTEK